MSSYFDFCIYYNMILLRYPKTGTAARILKLIPGKMNIKVSRQKWFYLPLFLVLLAACEKVVFEPIVIPEEDLSFAIDIQPIMDSKCVSCHPPTKGLDLTATFAYEELVPAYVTVADSANPEESSLYSKLIGTSHAPRTSEYEKQIILEWISQGVPE